MAVCPIDYRYGTPEMKEVFSARTRIDLLLKCEGALALVQERLGLVPEGVGAAIDRKATVENISLVRIEEIETETRHEMMAVIKALGEAVGGESVRYVHLGATSSDMLDTSMALQFRAANDVIEARLEELATATGWLVLTGRDMICIGRTHGQHAIPLTFGFKAAVWVMEVRRHLERLSELRPRIEVGKMSGAVGTGAGYGKRSVELEEAVLGHLGLGIEEISTQIVQRDRYVELICFLANVSTTVEKIATEVRNLQRTEIAEVSESFDAKRQVGSSTMAQKRNPITCENVCGLGRMVRAMVNPAFENAVQWHERDLSSSSSERFVISHAYVILDDMLEKMVRVLSGLSLDPAAMKKNLTLSGGLCMAEAVIMALVRKGLGRQEAHEMLRRVSNMCRENGVSLREGISLDERMKCMFAPDELEDILDPANYLGHVHRKIDAYIGK